MRWMILILALVGCDGEDPSTAQETPIEDAGVIDTAITDMAPPNDMAPVVDSALPEEDMALPDMAVDAAPPPAMEIMADAPPAYSAGECPGFEVGRNTFQAGAKDREFDLYLPPNPDGAPLLILWHPLGSSALQIGNFFGAQAIADAQGWIVAVPESLRTQTEWGFFGDATDDLALFDDLLACLDDQYHFNTQRLYISGFSAGALWSSYLIMHRAQHLNAALVLSGGVTSNYMSPAYALPVLLTWGGPNDQFGGVINFQDTTFTFRDALQEDSHPLVTCEHVGGHVPPPGVTDWGIEFLAGHTARIPEPAFTSDAPYPDTCTVIE